MAAANLPTDEWLEGLKDRLSKAMDARGLSQRDLAEQIGVTGSAVAQWMSRENTFAGWWRLRAVAEALHISADTLLGLPDAPAAPTPIDPRVVERLLQHLERAAESNAKAAAEARKVAGAIPD